MAAKIVCHLAAISFWAGTGGMPVVLLLVGVLTTAAGLLLVGAGLTVREGSFNTEVLTPGTIAVVGGLLLVAFALAVRELQRIERALMAPPLTFADDKAAEEQRLDVAALSPVAAAEKTEPE